MRMRIGRRMNRRSEGENLINEISIMKFACTAILILCTTVNRYYATLFKKNNAVRYSTVWHVKIW